MLNKESILAKLQETPYMSIRKLAEHFKVSYGKMWSFLKDNNIKTKSRSEQLAHRNKVRCTHSPIRISKEANQLILGSLLGDGSIFYKTSNCILSILHSTVQKDYILYKKDLFIQENLEVKLSYSEGYESTINGRKIKNNGRIYLYSKVNQSFNKYREQWYPRGIKIVPSSVYELEALGLAIWFMDDGSSNNSSFYLSTNSFSISDIECLVSMLDKNFNIKSSIHKNKDSHILYINSESKQLFIDTIKPYVCDSMIYKIIGHDKQDELLES